MPRGAVARNPAASRYAIDNARRRASQFIMRRLCDVNHTAAARGAVTKISRRFAIILVLRAYDLSWTRARTDNPSRSNCRE